MSVTSVKTPGKEREKSQGGKAYIHFSPRGFSEFAVIHFHLYNDDPVTLVDNPFTGLVTVYPGFRDFEWTYGKKNKGDK